MKKYCFIIIVSTGLFLLQASFTGKETADKAALGKLLFFDPILSKDSTVSCAGCHKPAYAFADTSAVSIGIGGRKGLRNTPTAMSNVAVTAPYMHNGMFKTLKEVIEFYNDPEEIVPGAINLDSLLQKPLGLTNQEINDLVDFLRALTDKSFQADDDY